MAEIYFKLEYTIRDLDLQTGIVLSYDYGGPHNVRLLLREPSHEEQKRGHKSQHTFCTAFSTYKPNNNLLEVFTQISKNQVLLGDFDPLRISTRYTTPEGILINIPNLDEFPDYFQSFIRSVKEELSDRAKRTISILRWRTNNQGLHNPISTRGLFWSFDNAFWHPAPSTIGIRIHFSYSLHISANQSKDVYKLVESGEYAPLYHDLFREAWNQRADNPRSSLLIGISAAELSIKKCISDLIPDSKWMVFNLPSPPIKRMLKEYLPMLPVRNKINDEIKIPSKRIIDKIEKGVLIRNQITHAGLSNPSVDVVEDILNAVHDLLYLIDFYLGYEWALDFLHSETKKELSIQ